MMQLFLDLDGVLADLDGYYESLFGVRPDRNKPPPPGFWKNIASRPNFFAELPPMSDSRLLWEGVRDLNPKVLTGLPHSIPSASDEKRAWVQYHFGDVDVICCESKDKCLHGKPGDILIDDWSRYRDRWVDMGGVFILHTSAEQSLLKIQEV